MSPSECAFKDVARDLGRLRPRFRSPDVVILNNAIDLLLSVHDFLGGDSLSEHDEIGLLEGGEA